MRVASWCSLHRYARNSVAMLQMQVQQSGSKARRRRAARSATREDVTHEYPVARLTPPRMVAMATRLIAICVRRPNMVLRVVVAAA